MSSVLLVEDEPDIRSLARLMLEASGYEVLEAPDGESALTLLDADPGVGVMLLDIRLPGRSGWDVLAELRGYPARRRPGVVVFSAQIAPQDRERARAEGAVGYLAKPFTEDELLSAVAGATA